MSLIDRTIALARTCDGRAVEQFGFCVRIEDGRAAVGECRTDPAMFATEACAAWTQWASIVPDGRRRGLIAEAGVVVAGTRTTRYSLVHADGAILEMDDAVQSHPASSDSIAWAEVPDGAALVLGPSATLALADFTLDGVLGVEDAGSWPFPADIEIADTAHSPYPPQHRDESGPVVISPRAMNQATGDDEAFMLLQRSERWQRPLNALYNIARRNLALGHRAAAAPAAEFVVVIDTLRAESEPTLAVSSWLATWYAEMPSGRRWGRERLALRCQSPFRGGGIGGAITPARPACICDPIEGDVFGLAPALLVASRASPFSIEAVPS
jgi:hypothetical protein